MKKILIMVMMIFLLSSVVLAESLSTSQKMDIVVEFENIKMNLAKFHSSVQNIISEYESSGNTDKVNVWEKVIIKIESLQEEVDSVINSMDDEVSSSFVMTKTKAISKSMETILEYSIEASTGKKLSKTTTTIKSDSNAAPGEAYEMYKDDIADAYTKGSKDAPIIMVEFSDFQCPYCKKFIDEAYQEILSDYVDEGKVIIAFRHLPLSFHDNAMPAALAAECAGEQGKFWEYHDLLFEDQELSNESLKSKAEDLGLDMDQFNDCVASEKYSDKIEADAAAAAGYGITGTPAFVVNGVTVVGALPIESFEAQFESALNPVEHKIYVLSDERCISCDASRLKEVTKQLFPSAEMVDVDVSDELGQQFVEDLGLEYAPALVFDKTVTESAGWKSNERLHDMFVEMDDYYYIDNNAIGSTWIIDDEERAKAQEKLNDALGLDMNDNKPQVDFFVMSYCPYGNQAEELLKPVYDKLKDKAVFNPRYVIYSSGSDCYEDDEGNQYCSMHGGQELHQNVRELCVLYSDGIGAWFDFALKMNDECTSQNADTCWKAVAEELGYDVDAIEKCEEENGLAYMKEDYELNQLLGVSGSPSVFFEGQQYSGERTANGYLTALCSGFEKAPVECDEVLEETTVAVDGQC